MLPSKKYWIAIESGRWVLRSHTGDLVDHFDSDEVALTYTLSLIAQDQNKVRTVTYSPERTLITIYYAQ